MSSFLITPRRKRDSSSRFIRLTLTRISPMSWNVGASARESASRWKRMCPTQAPRSYGLAGSFDAISARIRAGAIPETL